MATRAAGENGRYAAGLGRVRKDGVGSVFVEGDGPVGRSLPGAESRSENGPPEK